MLLFNIEIADPSIESIVQSSFANHIFSSRVFSSLFQVIKLCAHFLIYLHCTLARSKYRAFVEIVAYILWHRRKKKWSSMQQEVVQLSQSWYVDVKHMHVVPKVISISEMYSSLRTKWISKISCLNLPFNFSFV